MINQPENQESKPSKDNITEPPYVSVVIPAKNEEQYLPHCLNALQNLDYPKDRIEIIVVDNGSTDKTVEIARQKKATILNLPNGSISTARNNGALKAIGSILAFIDADIIVGKNWLKNAVKNLQDPTIGCTGGYTGIVDKPTWVERAWTFDKQCKKRYHYAHWISTANMILAKHIFQEVGGFDETLTSCEDVDICYKVNKKYRILYDKDVFVIHLREPKTLFEIFRKEVWRGQSNYAGVWTHGIRVDELPSLIQPLLYLTLFGLEVLFLITLRPMPAITVILCLILLPVLRTTMTIYKSRKISFIPRLILVWFVYYLARGVSPIYTIYNKVKVI